MELTTLVAEVVVLGITQVVLVVLVVAVLVLVEAKPMHPQVLLIQAVAEVVVRSLGYDGTRFGGAGGSGIVIVRYAIS